MKYASLAFHCLRRALELLQTSLQEKDTAERRAEKSEAECQHHKKKHEQSVKQVSEVRLRLKLTDKTGGSWSNNIMDFDLLVTSFMQLTAQLTDATQELEKLRTLIDAVRAQLVVHSFSSQNVNAFT